MVKKVQYCTAGGFQALFGELGEKQTRVQSLEDVTKEFESYTEGMEKERGETGRMIHELFCEEAQIASVKWKKSE